MVEDARQRRDPARRLSSPTAPIAAYTAAAPTTEVGATTLAAAARAVAQGHGANGDVLALAVRLLADDARRRCASVPSTPLLGLDLAVDGTELVVTLTDAGEPVSGAAASVLALVESGLLTACDATSGIGGNSSEVRLPLPAHSRLLDGDTLEVMADEVPISDSPVTMRPLEPSDAASLTRCLYRCYGWTYPGADFYYPDRIAASIASGRRIGEVAVDEHGEVVAHWGAVMVTPGLAETGAALTDPRFRKRGIVNALGERLLERLERTGVRGRLREPVVTHTATQQIALREGAHLVGFLVAALNPIDQIGITDGVQAERVSMTVMWSPLAAMTPSTVWIPSSYEQIVRTVLEPTDWPIEIGETRGAPTCPPRTALGSSFDAHNRVGQVAVTEVGSDLVDAVDDALSQLQRAGAAAIHVALPASQAALARQGAGLYSLGLSFCTFVPDDGITGDRLTLQWLRDAEVGLESWRLASEHVERIAAMVVDQIRAAAADDTRLRRREARRQQLFAALPADGN
ncbi:MAG: hypothetical protein ACO3C1_07135 [Ilumatobacteraceae bacterium]